MRCIFADNNDLSSQHLNARTQLQVRDQSDAISGKRRFESEDWVPQVIHGSKYTSALLGSSNLHESYRLTHSLPDRNPVKVDQMSKFISNPQCGSNLHRYPQAINHSNFSYEMLESSMKRPATTMNDLENQIHPSDRRGSHYRYGKMHDLDLGQNSKNLLLSLLPPLYPEQSSNSTVEKSDSMILQPKEVIKPKGDGNCKLFGISLNSNPVAEDQPIQSATFNHIRDGNIHYTSQHQQQMESDALLEQDKHHKSQEILEQLSRDVQEKSKRASNRSCIKVSLSYPSSF